MEGQPPVMEGRRLYTEYVAVESRQRIFFQLGAGVVLQPFTVIE
jgi:hypothetical protein